MHVTSLLFDSSWVWHAMQLDQSEGSTVCCSSFWERNKWGKNEWDRKRERERGRERGLDHGKSWYKAGKKQFLPSSLLGIKDQALFLSPFRSDRACCSNLSFFRYFYPWLRESTKKRKKGFMLVIRHHVRIQWRNLTTKPPALKVKQTWVVRCWWMKLKMRKIMNENIMKEKRMFKWVESGICSPLLEVSSR